ncbi:S9 family peptidase [Kangiella sp. HZ709]|uniref:S9 family peptidase n=1 Tax=Kangiella sp. HZ709 TaxID=2666328 RepID=UPI0012AF9D84|nr:S9 family peptidase [Kangiella sp. HZ709]MRX28299.1 prolyl oligopeptidase family serine peptidase [Kangiella sp. HZ709]
MKYLLILLSLAALAFGVYYVINNNKDDQAKEVQSKASAPIAASQEAAVTKPAEPQPPIARKEAFEMVIHDHKRVDNYYWMRDDERKDPEILAHLEAENAYKEKMLAHTEGLQKTLYDEIVSRIEKDNSSVPYFKEGYWYYRRFETDKEYPIYARKKGTLEAAEEIIVDVNAHAPKEGYFSISGLELGKSQQTLAYAEDKEGRRIYNIKFKNLETGKMYDDVLKNASSNIVWANDDEYLFYLQKDPQTLLADKVYRHKLGTPQSEDVLVYEENNKTFYTGIGKTMDSSMLIIAHSSTETKGMSFLDANNPAGDFELFYPLEEGHEYGITKSGDDIYIRTNKGAQNFRLMQASIENKDDFSKWAEIIPHDENTLLQGVTGFNQFLALSERNGGLSRIRLMDKDSGEFTTIPAKDAAYVMSMSTNVDPNAKTVRYYYSSLTTPGSTYDYDIASGKSELKKQDKVLGDFDADNYHSERISVKARDGKMVPVSIVYRKNTFKKDGTNPLYQYAYGSYGATIDPRFRSTILSLLDRGFVYAIAHIRGSQTLGRHWYEDGKMFNKINTFTDFIDVTDGLVAQGYGHKDKVVIAGGSAGGLLMGAVINMAPEKYKAVASHVPFVDVVTTMLDESIPLTTNEFNEWGNPKNKDSYEYMLSYSPYDQIERKEYPNMLVTTGLHDSQVQYFEPMKWVAKLREYKTGDNKLLFHTNMEAGHGGASGRFQRLKQTAMEYAFFMDELGMDK